MLFSPMLFYMICPVMPQRQNALINILQRSPCSPIQPYTAPTTLPARPNKIPTHAEPGADTPGASSLINRAFGDGALGTDTRNNTIQIRLNNNTTNNHLAEGSMEGLEVEDKVELADVLEEFIEGLDVDLDEVEEGEGGLGRGRDDDEIERRVVAVGHE